MASRTISISSSSADAWTGAIPPQPDGTVVSYSVDVTLDDGTEIAYPEQPRRSDVSGRSSAPRRRSGARPSISDPMWTRSGTAPAEWQWARPNVTRPESGDPRRRYDGTFIYGTNLVGPGALRARRGHRDDDADDRSRARFRSSTCSTGGGSPSRTTKTIKRRSSRATTRSGRTRRIRNGTLAHVDREWRFHDVDLTPHLYYDSIAVTWQLTTNGSGELGGWNLDDVCIVGLAEARGLRRRLHRSRRAVRRRQHVQRRRLLRQMRRRGVGRWRWRLLFRDGGGAGSATLGVVVGLCLKRRQSVKRA